MRWIWLTMIFFVLTVCTGCLSDSEEFLLKENSACDTMQMNYTQHMEPILAANCYSCHQLGIAEGNIILDSYASVVEYAENGRLIGAIDHVPGFAPMPRDGNKLSECEIARVRSWIREGTPP